MQFDGWFRFRGCLVATSTAMLLAACGGGGSAASSGVLPAPAGNAFAPALQTSGGGAGGGAPTTTQSIYTITSNPAGLAVNVGTNALLTPGTTTPPANTPLAVTFIASGYSVPILQVFDGPHSVFYNAASDSTGTVSLVSLQALHRLASGVFHAAPATRATRRVFHRALGDDIDPTRVVVRYSAARLQNTERTPLDIERSAGASGFDTPSATSDPLRIVLVPHGMDVAAFTSALQAHTEVAEVDSVHRRFLQTKQAVVLNDPFLTIPDQWYTFATGTNIAWAYTPGGGGSKLAMIDTGVDQHNADLAPKIAQSLKIVTPVDPTTGVPIPGATPTVSSPGQDTNGHGTNTAGIAESIGGNGAGFAGVAYAANAQLFVYDIFPDTTAASDSQSSDTADEAAAIQNAIQNHVDVISMSLGGASFDTAEFNAVEAAIQAGVTVVAAAGNSDGDSPAPALDYPAGYPNVISVGASALKDEFYNDVDPQTSGTYASSTEVVASYSQTAPELSVVAPGGDAAQCLLHSADCGDLDTLHWIEGYSTTTTNFAADACPTPSPATSCLTLFNGTSQATPQVSGTVALLASVAGHGALSPAQMKYLIESTADNINDPRQGHGRLNAYRALASLTGDTSAYSGPQPQAAGNAQLIAFAYNNSGSNRPHIVDASFPAGVPVASNGTFRIADVPLSVGNFRVAVWYDANGDGLIDAGDQVGAAPAACVATRPCAIGTITMQAVPAGYVLP